MANHVHQRRANLDPTVPASDSEWATAAGKGKDNQHMCMMGMTVEQLEEEQNSARLCWTARSPRRHREVGLGDGCDKSGYTPTSY